MYDCHMELNSNKLISPKIYYILLLRPNFGVNIPKNDIYSDENSIMSLLLGSYILYGRKKDVTSRE